MQNELITLFSRIAVPSSKSQANTFRCEANSLNAEISTFGYSFDKTVLDKIVKLSQPDFIEFRQNIHHILSEISGQNKNYGTLFKNFPYSTPDQHDYCQRRVIGILGNIFGGVQSNQLDVLSCGHVIDGRLFDLKTFGACPICQHQVDELDAEDTSCVFPFETITPLKVLSLADDNFIASKVTTLISRNSSLSQTERKFVREGKSLNLNIVRPTSIFKENIPLVLELTNDIEYISQFISGATDVLRIAYFNSDPDSDLSLKDNVRFDLTTSQKKKIFKLLDGYCPNIAEDMLRDRERWLRLGEKINPASQENTRKFPTVAAAFDKLRNNPESIPSFNRTIESKIRSKTVDSTMIDKLSERPGDFIRRLDFVLREGKDTTAALTKLRKVVTNVTPKMLFEIEKYLIYRRDNPQLDRVFIPKGKENKIKVFKDQRKKIDESVLDAALSIVRTQNYNNLSSRPHLGKVYIDPSLQGVLLPFNRRGDSNTITQAIKGSRYPFGNSAFIRLFVWWQGSVDVDLSVMSYADNFAFMGQVSFTNLRTDEMVHSGDIQSAPKGGSEFIDLNVSKLLARGVRYIVSSVISYRGEKFNTFPCFAGYMERDGLRTGKKYEPESVKIKFDLKSETTSHCPIIFDLMTNEVIFADISLNTGSHTAVSSCHDKFTTIAKAIVELPKQKPTVYDVLYANVAARGQIVDDPLIADVSYTLENLDIDSILTNMVG